MNADDHCSDDKLASRTSIGAHTSRPNSAALIPSPSAASPFAAHDRDPAVRTPLIVLAVLIGLDLTFIGLHLVHAWTGLLPSSRWSIERDRGFAELLQYAKFAGVCLALGQVYLKTRMRSLFAWIAVFVVLLLDDSVRLHERAGLGLVAWLQIPGFGALRGRDIGELILASVAFVLVAPPLALGCLRGSPRSRALCADLAVLLAGLVACGIGVDVIHRLASASSLNLLAGVIEDGGEMLVLSLTCFYVMQWVSAHSLEDLTVRFKPGARLAALANGIALENGRQWPCASAATSTCSDLPTRPSDHAALPGHPEEHSFVVRSCVVLSAANPHDAARAGAPK